MAGSRAVGPTRVARPELARGLALGLVLALDSGLACGDAAVEPPAPAEAREARDPGSKTPPAEVTVERLTQWEQQQREHTDFTALPPWSERAGADPFALLRLPGGATLGLLRGEGTIVALDDRGRALDRVPAVVDATGWAHDDTTLYVVGPRDGLVYRYRLAPQGDTAPIADGSFAITGATSLRTIAIAADGVMAVGDGFEHRVFVVDPPPRDRPTAEATAPLWSSPCRGPLAVRWIGGRLLALCMLDHAVLAWRIGPDADPEDAPRRIEHDGPIWSLDAAPLHDPTAGDGATPALRLALGGVEDHPLDRSDGAFGYIDSFVFVVDLPSEGAPERRAEVNVSALGAITPKWTRLHVQDDRSTVHVLGYGGDAMVTLQWDDGFDEAQTRTRRLVPGITDAWVSPDGRTGLAADPLLDAWIRWAPHDDARGEDDETDETDETDELVAVEVVPLPDDRPVELRVGEALAFTGLMGPGAISEGKRSRFTCETCHFEGGVDGRVHWTGRQQVHASTRPLRGLFNNRPHFSRALDPTMARMVHNEFDVASRGTEADPWFSVSPDDPAWLRHLGVTEPLDAEALRRSLMQFLMAFTPEPNPRALADASGSEDARVERGAQLFATHCERCHAARLVTDDPSTRVDPAHWRTLVRSPAGPIVWAEDRRVRTGIEPYVHPDGARVPSLRRLAWKWPYFTNGSASTLDAVLERFSPEGAADPEVLEHVRTVPLAHVPAFDTDERAALRAFLERL